MKNIAVILAGGVGRRLGLTIPKQFLKMAGKTVLEHTVDSFQQHEMIDEIAIVSHPMFTQKIEEMVSNNRWTKVKKILNGGETRFESSLSAIRAYELDENQGSINLIFHDGVRPLVSERVISDVCHALQTHDAVDVVVPAVDTIVKVRSNQPVIDSIPDRSLLRRGQTPQGFKLITIRAAYELALKDPNLKTTDDCGIVVKYLPSTEVVLIKGEECNIKLTNPEDIYLLDKLFQLKSTVPRPIDLTELKGKTLIVFGGTSGIGKEIATMAKQNNANVYVFSRREGHADVSDIHSVRRVLQSVYSITGQIDFVVNTAAILNKEPLLHLTDSLLQEIVQINYIGAVNTTLAAYEYLKKSHGQVLQFTSSSYTRGRANYAMYSSTKAAIVNFIQAMAEEWRPDRIRLNCINPQRTKTPMRQKNFGVEDESTLLKPEAVAKISLETLLNSMTGEVVDIRLSNK